MKTKQEINKRWREGKGKEYNKNYYLKNKDKILNNVKEYTIRNTETIKEYQKTYRLNNRNKINNTIRKYYNKYPWRKIWRGTLNNALNRLKVIKNDKTINLLGYSYEDLKLNLESKFTKEMNWDNYGTYWVVDHIKPVSKFKINTDIKEIHSLNNLQPLEKIKNLNKAAKYEQ